MKFGLLFMKVVLLIALTGCQSTKDDGITIGGKTFDVDETGAIVLTRDQLEELKNKKSVTFVENKHVEPQLELSVDELTAAAADNQSLFTMLGIHDSAGVVTLVKSGSLKSNLRRMLAEQKWGAVYFEGSDIHIEKPFVVQGEDLGSVLLLVLSEYDVFMCMDEADKSITVIKNTD